METISLPYIQILMDIIFFATIMFLLRLLNNNIQKHSSAISEARVCELRKILSESHEAVCGFVESMEENKRMLGALFLQLEEKEKRLAALMGKAQASIQSLECAQHAGRDPSSEKRYHDVVAMVRQGVSRQEVSKRLGVAAGEVDLIVDLARAGSGHHA